jgi:transposase InsO family protein
MHANAPLSPLGRAQTVRWITEQGLTARSAAAERGVSDRSVRRWLKYYLADGQPVRLHARSFVPHRQPRKSSPAIEARILELRRQRKSYAEITLLVPVSRATVYRVLKRHGLNRLKYLLPAPPPVIRYERDTPGELVHLDIKKLGRFDKPGVRGTGNRADRNEGAGTESLHVAIDDHSRVGFACVHPNEKIPSVIAALIQVVSFFALHRIKVTGLMTDNGSSYRSKPFAAACKQLGIRHHFTRPYRPQTNGKAERFIQTLTREWAYAHLYCSSNHRNAFLPYYIDRYNSLRPHSSLNHLPPASRLPLYAANVSMRYS